MLSERPAPQKIRSKQTEKAGAGAMVGHSESHVQPGEGLVSPEGYMQVR